MTANVNRHRALSAVNQAKRIAGLEAENERQKGDIAGLRSETTAYQTGIMELIRRTENKEFRDALSAILDDIDALRLWDAQ
ncbi:hypothetical protein [Atlantibacter hermannii]|uniref:hypothetical protein n=1 Tax=Atlantibacter hermannii TaxID=565 RepID=UPI0028AA3F2D|nr:hypothetical protein [Atlantibacter hermannii]